MVDKERRKKLALHLRHFSVGLTYNDTFENRISEDVAMGWLPEQYHRSKEAKSDDPIIVPMLELCWGLYDDTRLHKLTGSRKLTPENIKLIARCILFLHSDKEYEWPYFDTKFNFSFLDLLVALLTLGQNFRNKRKESIEAYKEFQKQGDFEYWPFIRKQDYEKQLEQPPFLTGDVVTNV